MALTSFFDFIWGIPLTTFIILAGAIFTYSSKFTPFRTNIIIKNTLGTVKDEKESMKIFFSVLGGTIGGGNISGIATAVAVGGPGAIFWMWIIALLSMSTKMMEVTLATAYHRRDENGNYVGGAMYYISKVRGKAGKSLAFIYSIALFVYVMCDSGFVQINTVATSLSDTFHVKNWIICLAIISISVFFLSGGIKRISSVLKNLVPTMSFFYIVFSIFIICRNINNVPQAINVIISYAFHPAPAVGGFLGASVMQAISKGSARGIFANEAGIGSSASVHATSNNKPVVQGMWGILEVGFVSFCVCTITALVIIVSGAWKTGLDGAPMVLYAFESSFGSVGKYILCVAIVLFSYTTYIGFFYEYNACLSYFFREKIVIKYAKWFYIMPIFFAVFLPMETIWMIADISVGFIVVPNILSLLFLRKEYSVEIKHFYSLQVKNTEEKR